MPGKEVAQQVVIVGCKYSKHVARQVVMLGYAVNMKACTSKVSNCMHAVNIWHCMECR